MLLGGMSRALGGVSCTSVMQRLFLLSPASTTGKRTRILLSPRAGFPLAVQVRSEGAGVGQVFAFLSGLYFRGKLTYATHFAGDSRAVRVITCDRGLLPPDHPVTAADLRQMSRGDIDLDHSPYRQPLERDAALLATQLAADGEVILLGSIATGKYAE